MDANIDISDVEIEESNPKYTEGGSRVTAAIKHSARLELELEKKNSEIIALKERIEDLERRDFDFEEENATNEQKCKELEYQCRRLGEELTKKSQLLRDEKLRNNARLAKLSDSLGEAEDLIVCQARQVFSASHHLQKTILDLQRHMGTRGFHAINSLTARRLMENLWDASNKLCETCEFAINEQGSRDVGDLLEQYDDPDEVHVSLHGYDSRKPRSSVSSARRAPRNSMSSRRRLRNPSNSSTSTRPRTLSNHIREIKSSAMNATLTLAARGGKIEVLGDSSEDSVIRNLSELCKKLESEKDKQAKQMHEMKAMLDARSSSTLIQNYRSEIMKGRAHSKALARKLSVIELEKRELESLQHTTQEKRNEALATVKGLKTQVEDIQKVRDENEKLRKQVSLYEEANKKRRKLLHDLKKTSARKPVPHKIETEVKQDDSDPVLKIEKLQSPAGMDSWLPNASKTRELIDEGDQLHMEFRNLNKEILELQRSLSNSLTTS